MLTTITRKPRLAAITVIPLLVLLLAAVSGAQSATPKHLSKKEVAQLIETAKSPADHMQLARYFSSEAAKFEAEADEHADMAKRYQRNPSPLATKFPGSMQTFNHCDALSKSLREAARSARELAASHEQMAKDAGADPR